LVTVSLATLLAVGAAGLLASARASASDGASFTIATGAVSQPAVLVDSAGTAHVVWNETVNGGADVLHYCRVENGKRACVGAQSFTPPEDYSLPGNSAAFNTQFAGLEIVASGTRLVIMTHRYPNIVQKPDGSASSDATYLWVSDDGGKTFGPADLVGDNRFSGGAVSLGAMIATISDTQTGGTFFQAVAPGGYSGGQANLGDTGPDQAYDGSVADLDATTPVAAFDDLGNTTYIRQYSGSGDINAVGSWAPPTRLPASNEPRLVGGPHGVFLITRAQPTGSGGPYVVRRYTSGGTLSPPATVAGPEAIRRQFLEDAAGGLHVAWFDRTTSGGHAMVRLRSSGDGTAWGPPATLADVGEADVNDLRLGGGADGSGLAVWTSSLNGNSTIVAAPYAPDAPATAAAQTANVRANGVTSLKIACLPPGPCAGTASLLAGTTAVSARAAARTVFARARFSIRGRTGKVKLRLSPKARRLLASHHGRLYATAKVVSVRGTHRLTSSAKITLRRRG
jgi:hypothetical protein